MRQRSAFPWRDSACAVEGGQTRDAQVTSSRPQYAKRALVVRKGLAYPLTEAERVFTRAFVRIAVAALVLAAFALAAVFAEHVDERCVRGKQRVARVPLRDLGALAPETVLDLPK